MSRSAPTFFTLALLACAADPEWAVRTFPSVDLFGSSAAARPSASALHGETPLHDLVDRLSTNSLTLTDLAISYCRELGVTNASFSEIIKGVGKAQVRCTDCTRADIVHNVCRVQAGHDVAPRSTAWRVSGFLNLANLVWLASVAGIAAFALPFFAMLVPSVMLLFFMSRHVAEILVYLFSLCMVVQGFRDAQASSDHYLGVVRCSLGVALAYASYGGTLLLHPMPEVDGHRVEHARAHILVDYYGMLWTAPVALVIQSKFVAFFAVANLYSVLGFSTTCRGLCYAVGFHGEATLQRARASSLLILLAQWAARASASSPLGRWAVFEPACAVFGTIVYLLATLCIAGRWTPRHYGSYESRQVGMVFSLAVCFYAGSVYHMPGVVNTAIVFSVLYGLEKLLEVPGLLENTAMVGFLGSLALYKVAGFLSTHPDFVSAMFAV